MEDLGIFIFLYIVSLFILYIVIETAVRRGINSSIIGRTFEDTYKNKKDKKSFLDNDLDQD